MSDGHKEEIVIVGGGLAGSSAAFILASAGRPALLIERDAEPRHKVCGEFLSIEAQAYLVHLGIDLDALGASRISRLRLVRKRRLTEVSCPSSPEVVPQDPGRYCCRKPDPEVSGSSEASL